jgi:hypothetical protein
MPPRYAYWTILIDSKPTAFRAREKEELLPTFHQLRRTSKDVVMKWFARGRLWETPEEASAAQRKKVLPERRGHEWRPGGTHKDPRERFKKGAKRHDERPVAPRGFRPEETRPARKPSGAWQGSRPPYKPSGSRPPYKPAASRSPYRPSGGAQDSRLSHNRPPHSRGHSSRPPDKPSGKPAGVAQVFRPAHKSRERRPWTHKSGSGTGASEPRRDDPRRTTFTPERRESEAPTRPVDDPRPEPPPRPEGPDKKPEPPERG